MRVKCRGGPGQCLCRPQQWSDAQTNSVHADWHTTHVCRPTYRRRSSTLALGLGGPAAAPGRMFRPERSLAGAAPRRAAAAWHAGRPRRAPNAQTAAARPGTTRWPPSPYYTAARGAARPARRNAACWPPRRVRGRSSLPRPRSRGTCRAGGGAGDMCVVHGMLRRPCCHAWLQQVVSACKAYSMRSRTRLPERSVCCGGAC